MAENASPLERASAFMRTRQFTSAESTLREALGAEGAANDVELLNGLGNALAAQGRLRDAEAVYQQALGQQPTFYKSLNNLANLLRGRGDLLGAVDLYRRALDVEPESHRAHANLGLALLMLNRPDEAVVSLTRSLSLAPDAAIVWSRLAEAQSQRGQVDLAISAFEEALKRAPDDAELHRQFGNLLDRHGKLKRAIEHLEKAVLLSPSSALAHADLGVVHSNARNLEPATKALDKSIKLAPSAYALNALGLLLHQVGRGAEGIALLERAIAMSPNEPTIRVNLGDALLVRGQVTRAVDILRTVVDSGANLPPAHSNLCLALHYDDAYSTSDIYREHRRWAARYADPVTERVPLRTSTDLDPARRLRIGYVSGDFRGHSVAAFFEPIATHHDRQQVDVFLYSNVARPDATTEALKARADLTFRDVRGVVDERLAELVKDDQIDILVELGGHTGDSRLLAMAHRPAPIQVNYLGYPGTTGALAIDYRLTDAIADPDGAEDHHREALVRLPGGAWCFGDVDRLPNVNSRPSGQPIVFGSFNNLAKVRPPVLDAWAKILARVPKARLIVKAKGLRDPNVRSELLASLVGLGVDPERVELVGWSPEREAHHARYGDVDIALDTFPYNGTTTTCEALAMGVPVVALTGDRHAARVSTSLLHRVGLDALCAETVDQYVDIACALAGDAARRAALRSELRDRVRGSALGDPSRFVPTLEQAYRQMWQRHCEQEGFDHRLFQALPLADVAEIVVPHTLSSISSYVLLEQGDWFEDEVRFVRRLLRPGERAVDVGANLGMYALSMAAAVGREGRVWAFEPGPVVASMLRASATRNGFHQLDLQQLAVSDHVGAARFYVSSDSELSSLHADAAGSTAMQIDVTLTTLDEASERLDMGDVAFVKLDAEGEERAIVDGGRSFLQRTEPLVMYEVRHGAQVRTDLVAHFETLGFQTYRLVAGLGALVPFDLKSAVDPVPLNLFSCSPATAARLSERDLLVRELPAGLVMPPGTNPVLHAVERYRWAVEGKGPLAIRAVELKGAFERLRDHATENPVVHLALARVARAWGERGAAVNALRTASDALSRGAPLDPVELCTNGPLLLAPLERLEGKRPGEMDERQWARAMAIAALEETAGYSSFFAPLKSRERLALLNDLGFEDAQLARRRALVDELCELVSVVNA